MPRDLPERWRGFLTELDTRLTHDVQLHCCGGFVVTVLYGFARTTADLDVLSVIPNHDQRDLATLAGQGSEIHKKYKTYLDVVTIVTHPDGYDSRLTEMFPRAFHHLQLLALDPYDLVLTKLPRNAERDRADVEYLATAVPLDPTVLQERYSSEMRGYLGAPERDDLTLELWIEIIQEALSRR